MFTNPIHALHILKQLPGRIKTLEDRAIVLEEYLRQERAKNSRLEVKTRELEKMVQYSKTVSLEKAQYPLALSVLYHERTGNLLNLSNPRTYNEKIQWFKIYGITSKITRLADKYRVREFVADRIGEEYLVPLLGVWKYPEEIDFSLLPDQFVLKANHGCGYNYIVTNKSQMDEVDVLSSLRRWLLEDYSFKAFEMQYHNIPRRILAEEYIENRSGNLNDYKFRCFNGKVELISFVTDRYQGIKMDWFDREWNTLPITLDGNPHSEKPVPRPDNLDEMIEIAETLAAGFPHVRVDLYRLDNGRIYFGEMTFTPSSGMAKWDSPEWDYKLGSLFTYPGMPK